MIETSAETAPAHWASYLINGDDSGISAEDVAACDAWQERLAPWYVVCDVEDSERFTWSYRLHGGDSDGGAVLDYVIHKESGK